MHKTRHTEEQVLEILKKAAAGTEVADVIRKHGISEQISDRWKSTCGVEMKEVERLIHLEDRVSG